MPILKPWTFILNAIKRTSTTPKKLVSTTPKETTSPVKEIAPTSAPDMKTSCKMASPDLTTPPLQKSKNDAETPKDLPTYPKAKLKLKLKSTSSDEKSLRMSSSAHGNIYILRFAS